MKRDVTDYPPITKRIIGLVNNRYEGNVNRFCQALGLDNSVKVNRLFKRDPRNNEYPTPSTDIILLICNNMDVSPDWLLMGKYVYKFHKDAPDINIPAFEPTTTDIYSELLSLKKDVEDIRNFLEK